MFLYIASFFMIYFSGLNAGSLHVTCATTGVLKDWGRLQEIYDNSSRVRNNGFIALVAALVVSEVNFPVLAITQKELAKLKDSASGVDILSIVCVNPLSKDRSQESKKNCEVIKKHQGWKTFSNSTSNLTDKRSRQNHYLQQPKK